MTVLELKKILENIPDNIEIEVYDGKDYRRSVNHGFLYVWKLEDDCPEEPTVVILSTD